MKLGLLSSSYKNTAVEKREKLAVPAERTRSLIAFIKQECHLDEVMILSTCNRVEVGYIHQNPWLKKKEVLDAFLKFLELPDDIREEFIFFEGSEAVNHYFRVASSLESLVVGEPQILGQVKDSYQLSKESDGCAAYLNRIANHAFSVAKKVRSETGIARYAVSISYTAVELAKKIFDDLSDKVILIIGAGEMAELAATHLMKAGISHIMVANRTFTTAVELAEKFGGSAVPFDAIDLHMESADIVISSTGAKGYVVTSKMVRKCLTKRKYKPVFFVDIAVPRDIDPEINEISNAYVYDIDDLQSVVDSNRQEREKEAERAQEYIDLEVELFNSWTSSLQVVPAIKALKTKFHQTLKDTMERNPRWKNGLNEKQKEAVEQLLNSYANKLLHNPVSSLRGRSDSDAQDYLHLLSDLFDLNLSETKEESSNKVIALNEKTN